MSSLCLLEIKMILVNWEEKSHRSLENRYVTCLIVLDIITTLPKMNQMYQSHGNYKTHQSIKPH